MEVAVQTRLQFPPFANNNDDDHVTQHEQRPISSMSTNLHTTVERFDEIDRVSLELATDIVQYVGRNKDKNKSPSNGRRPSAHATTMRRVVDEILRKHEYLYNGMVKKLNFAEVDVRCTCRAIADELFADGKINWGRIVALYAFIGRLAKYFGDAGVDADDYSSAMAAYLAEYVGGEMLHGWISKQGGWDKFVEHFPAEDSNLELKLFKGLIFTGVGLGLFVGYLFTR